MILGILIVQNSGSPDQVTKWILAVCAGSFLYIALVDLVPEMSKVHIKALNPKMAEESVCDHHANSWKRVIAQHMGIISGWVIMVLIALYAEDIKLV